MYYAQAVRLRLTKLKEDLLSVEKRTPEQKTLADGNPKLKITPGVLYQYNPKAADELKALAAKEAAKRAERPAEGGAS